jgi:hypothetical protein
MIKNKNIILKLFINNHQLNNLINMRIFPKKERNIVGNKLLKKSIYLKSN